MDKLISVIIPCYNVEKYLDRCLESVVNQTYKNLEIILVDDGSTDNTPNLCDKWAEKDSRIIVFHKENGGVSSARNVGLDKAKGDYITFVDSDDYLLESTYSNVLDISEKNNADIVCYGYYTDKIDNVRSNLRNISHQQAIIFIVSAENRYGFIWNKLYKKSVIKNNRFQDLVCCEDLLFNYYVFKNARRIYEIDTQYYCYFQNSDSTVHNTFSIGAFDAVKSKEIIINDCKGTDYEKYAIAGYVKSAYVVLSGCIKNNKFLYKYNELRQGILKNKQYILFSKEYSINHKIRTIILWFFPKLYNKLVYLKG